MVSSFGYPTQLTWQLAVYRGSVNDPTTFPPPSKTHGSYHWAFERLLSAGLLPLTVAAFATSTSNYPLLDGLLGVSLVMHSHIGVRASISRADTWHAYRLLHDSSTPLSSTTCTRASSLSSVASRPGLSVPPPLAYSSGSINSTQTTLVRRRLSIHAMVLMLAQRRFDRTHCQGLARMRHLQL